jgi:hypothetical protein
MKTTVTFMPAKAAQTEEQVRQANINGAQYRFNKTYGRLEYLSSLGYWAASSGFGGSADAHKIIADLITNPSELVEVSPETPEEIVIEIRVSREEATELQRVLSKRLPYDELSSHLVNTFTSATWVQEGGLVTSVS